MFRILQSNQPKTFRAHVLLAALNLLMIVIALSVTNLIVDTNLSTVATSRKWAERVAAYDHLQLLAGNVNAPANEVFASHNLESERVTLERNYDSFKAAMLLAREELGESATVAESASLIKHLARLHAAVSVMAENGRGVFEALEFGDPVEAAARSAVTDRQFSVVRKEISELMDVARGMQEANLAAQGRKNQIIGIAERVLAVLVFAVVIVITSYALRGASDLRVSDERKHRFEGMRRLIAAFENAIDGIAFIDTNNHFSFVNFAYASASGTTPDDLLGRSWADRIHPEDRDEWTRSLAEVHAWGRTERELRGVRLDGTTFYQRVVLVSAEDGGPEIALYCFMKDITEEKQSAREIADLSRRNALILNSAADGIFGIDINGNTTFVNEAASRMLGWSIDELVRAHMHDLVHNTHENGTEYPWKSCPSYKTVNGGEFSGSSSEVFRRRDGSSMAVEYTSSPIRDEHGAVVGGVVTFRDITERRAVEKMKDEFVSVVSHELRTPLTSIRGALGLLASGRINASSDKAQRMLEIAVTNTDRLIRLINDILDIERMESGQITLTKTLCNVPDLVAQAVEVMRPMAEKASVRVLSKAEPCAVVADSDRLLQTLTNLISNAIKFSPSGTTVTVTALEGAGLVEFEVGDQGRGIPADKLELIFERFQQVDASDSRQKGGSGLGLAICRSIVRQHGGDISVESSVGSGSRFRFFIPAPNSVAVVAATADTRPTVLICDDDDLIVDAAVAIAEAGGFRAIGVSNGRDLLDQAVAVAPDAIVLDLFMPNLNGWETLAALRQQQETADIPVIILSVLSPEDTGTPAHSVAGWIQKPLEARKMIDTLQQAIGPDRQGRVLVVEADPDLAHVMTQVFRRGGHRTFHAATAQQAIDLAGTVRPDLVVLDPALSDGDGFALALSLKQHKRMQAVAMVVYSAAEPTAIQREKLCLGPTEYLTKSRVTPEELQQRVSDLLETIVVKKGELSNVA